MKVKAEIKDLNRDVTRGYLGLLVGKIAAVEMDGGKDIKGNKLVCTTLLVSKCSFLHDLFNTEMKTLGGDWHKAHIIRIIRELDKNGVFVPSVTLDNEVPCNSHA